MTCNIDTCAESRYALGLCQAHYLDHYRGRPPRRRTTTAVLPPSWKVPRP